jgi:hypothetical protein
MPVVSFPAAIAVVGLKGAPCGPGQLIVNPARSMVTKLVAICRHTAVVVPERVRVRLLTSLYEPG